MAPEARDNEPLALQIRHFFATPIAAAVLPDAEARNAELKAAIAAERAAHPSRAASNLGGWHSTRPLQDWGGARVNDILSAAWEMAARMTFDQRGRPVRPEWTIRAWANVNGHGHANAFHYHPGAFWSGTYYVDDGGRLADDTLGGEFEIMDPRGPGVNMYAPELGFSDGAQNTGASPVQFVPRPGLITLFPSWLLHQVKPYRGHGERISIAFNLMLERDGTAT